MIKKAIESFLTNEKVKKHRDLMMGVLDTSIVLCSMLISYVILYRRTFFSLKIESIITTLIITVIVYAFFYLVFGVYKSLWKYISTKELTIILTMVTVTTGSVIVLSTFLGLQNSILLYLVGALFTFFLMVNVRFMYRWIRYSTVTNVENNTRSLIIGAGNGGYLLLKELRQNTKYNTKVVGFIDDNRAGHVVSGVKVLGTTSNLKELVKEYHVNVLYIAIPSSSKKDVRRIYDLCLSTGCKTLIMAGGNDLLSDSLENKQIRAKDVSIEDLLGRGEVKLNQEELKEYIHSKTIMVTGAGGSIGSELCRQISKFNPSRLVMLDINENGLYMLEQEFNRMRAHGTLQEDVQIISYIASIREYHAIDQIIKKEQPDAIYHAAAHKHVPLMETRPMEAIKNNVFGTNNVIQACIANKVPRFIMISTDKAVNPTNVMGATKRMTELLLQANGNNGVTKMAAVRFGNVLGSNGSVIPIFKKQIEEGGPVTLTHKGIIRYFMTIPEAAQLVLQAGYYADKGEIFVLDMGEPVKIIDLATKLITLSGYEPYKDIDIVEIGLRPGEKMFEELHLDGEDTSKTKNDLIFVNHVLGIPKDIMTQKLDELHLALDNDESPEQLKDRLLTMIK